MEMGRRDWSPEESRFVKLGIEVHDMVRFALSHGLMGID